MLHRCGNKVRPALSGRFLRSVVLFLFSALFFDPLFAQDATPPAAVSNLSAVTGSAAGEVLLGWTAPGDDGAAGDIAGGRFAVHYATYAVNFSSSLAKVMVSTGLVQGSSQSYTIPGLSPGVTYYFRLWTRDEVELNWSALSNAATAWAQLGVVSTPTAPGGFSGLALSPDSIKLVWTDDSANETGYRVRGSTPVVEADLPADSTYYIQAGLNPNTSYYRAVEVYNSGGAAEPAPVTVYTLSAPSSGAYVVSRSSWGTLIAWQANGNPPLTRWGIERSTDNFSTYQVLKSSSDAYTVLNCPDTGLADLTTYYYRVNSFNADALPSAYGAVVSTITLSTPAAPGSFLGAVLGVSSISWTWTDDAYNEDGYRFKTSAGGLLSALPPGATVYLETGLGGNQACARTVEAYNGAGYALSAGATFYTFSRPPSGSYVYFRSSWSAGIAWQANNNSAGTRWGIERSTDSFSTYQVLKSSSDAFIALNYLDTGLADLTTYYYRVNGFNSDSLAGDYGSVVSTFTVSTPTAPGGFVGVALGSDSIKFSWTDNAYNEEGYRVRSSTGGALYTLAPNVTYYIESGLAPNTSYYRVVEAYNGAGAAGAPYAVVYTSAAAPSGLYIVARSSWRVTIGWTANGNPAGTVWGIERSLVPGFSPLSVLKTSTENYTALTYQNSGLTETVLYYYRVRGFNGDGFAGPYSLAVSTVALSTPAAPTGYTGVPMDANSIRWAWTDNSAVETGYRLKNSTGGQVVALSANSNFYLETGLAVNKPYIRSVEVYNAAGSTGTAMSTVNTLSVPPINPDIVTTSYSALVSWNPNGNPAGTYWGIERSTDYFSTTQVLKIFEDFYTDISYLDTGLDYSTFYYYRVRSYNNASIPSGSVDVAAPTLAEVIPDSTAPDAAADLAASPGVLGGEALLRWTAPGDDGALGDISTGAFTIHYITYATGTFNFGQAQVSVSTSMAAGSAQAYMVGGLSPGVTYYFGLWTRDEPAAGNWSNLSNRTTAWAQVPEVPSAPQQFSGAALSSTSIMWTWMPALYQTGYRLRVPPSGLIISLSSGTTLYAEQGLAVNTEYTRYVQAYNYSGASTSAPAAVYTMAAPPGGFGFSSVNYSSVTVSWTSNGNAAGAPYRLEYWGVDGATSAVALSALWTAIPGLAESSSYYFRVGAVNGAGLISWSPATLAALTLGLPRISSGVPVQSDVRLELEQFAGKTSVDIPAGAFSEPLEIVLKTPLNYPPETVPAPGKPGMAGLEILTGRPLQPARAVTITITYSDGEVAGLNQERLAIARYDAGRGAWLALASSADPVNRRVTAKTDHFSLFRLFEVNPSQTILKPTVYPNPFRPSLGQTEIKFKDLPGGAILKIYALDGNKVRVIKCNGSGVAVWDARNTAGHAVASGLYFVYAESGTDSKIMTVVVQR